MASRCEVSRVWGSIGVCVAGLLTVAPSALAATASTTYTGAGTYTFTVPADVTSLAVTAIGGAGGGADGIAGGMGASVTDPAIAVSPGESLAVIVGGAGGSGGLSAGGAAGFPDGGSGGDPTDADDGLLDGGGGGGSSSVSRVDARVGGELLLLAGAGGGAGGGGDGAGIGGPGGPVFGSNGSNASGSCGPSDCGGGGIGANGLTPGTAGAGDASGSPGSNGAVAGGGAGGNPGGAGDSSGGGGGGGLSGGGGGGAGLASGGGGGGSSFEVSGTATGGQSSSPASVMFVYAAPTVTATPSNLSFGTVPQGIASTEQTVTVTNTAANGQPALTVTSVVLSGTTPSDYIVTNGCTAAVAAGGSCPIEVRFAPQAQGASSASLTITTDAAAQPSALALSGTGGPLPQGPKGATGTRGPAGRIELVTCTTVKVRGKSKQHCTTKLTSKPVKFKTARATLSRGRVIYARGTASLRHGSEKLSLRDIKRLKAGRYTLTLTYGHRTTHTTITIA
jgi:hypothetical protein